jgi:hypothetical protein
MPRDWTCSWFVSVPLHTCLTSTLIYDFFHFHLSAVNKNILMNESFKLIPYTKGGSPVCGVCIETYSFGNTGQTTYSVKLILQQITLKLKFNIWLSYHSFLPSALDTDEYLVSRLSRFATGEITCDTTAYEAGLAPEPVSKKWWRNNSHTRARIRTPARSARSLITILTTPTWNFPRDIRKATLSSIYLVNHLIKIYIKDNVKYKILCSDIKIPVPKINTCLRRLLGEKINKSEVSSVQLKSSYRIWLHTVKREISQVGIPGLLLLARWLFSPFFNVILTPFNVLS